MNQCHGVHSVIARQDCNHLTQLVVVAGALHDGFDAPCRAQQLAEVALTAYEARPGIHLPLEPTHPLLTVIKQALAKESDSTAGHKLAAALLDGALQAVDTTEGPQETDSFSYLLVCLRVFQ